MIGKTYLSQVRSLRNIAYASLENYPLKVNELKFIQHGENATFRVTDKKNNRFLLRVHRPEFHTNNALSEELSWLTLLSINSNIIAPVPINNLFNKKITEIQGRNTTMLKWIEGKQIKKSLNVFHMKKLAYLIADLHKHTKSYKVKYRNYWNSEGLVGKNSSMAPLDNIIGITNQDQQVINQSRIKVLTELKKYEKKNKAKMGLIHADLHFGNIFINKGVISPIDFDDCGYGFHIYDLAVTLEHISHRLKNKVITKKQYNDLRESFLNSYSERHSLDEYDLQTINTLEVARRLFGLQWLNSRFDNPRLKKHIKPYAIETVKILKNRF